MARAIVKDFKPDIATRVGGYCSGPTLKAAQRAGIPTLIQEQEFLCRSHQQTACGESRPNLRGLRRYGAIFPSRQNREDRQPGADKSHRQKPRPQRRHREFRTESRQTDIARCRRKPRRAYHQ